MSLPPPLPQPSFRQTSGLGDLGAQDRLCLAWICSVPGTVIANFLSPPFDPQGGLAILVCLIVHMVSSVKLGANGNAISATLALLGGWLIMFMICLEALVIEALPDLLEYLRREHHFPYE